MPAPKNSEKTTAESRKSAVFGRIHLVVAFFALSALFLLAFAFDEVVTTHLTNWPEAERAFFAALARIGESDWMLIPTLLVWAICRLAGYLPLRYSIRWIVRATGAMSGFIFLAVAVPGAIAALLKVAIGRARPMLMDDLGIFHFTPFAGDWRFAGFPSGHATTAFALAWALYFLFGPRVLIVFVGAALLALSRIVDGVHYFTDVVAGIALGSFGAMWVQSKFQQRGWVFSSDKKRGSNRMLAPYRRFFRKLLQRN